MGIGMQPQISWTWWYQQQCTGQPLQGNSSRGRLLLCGCASRQAHLRVVGPCDGCHSSRGGIHARRRLQVSHRWWALRLACRATKWDSGSGLQSTAGGFFLPPAAAGSRRWMLTGCRRSLRISTSITRRTMPAEQRQQEGKGRQPRKHGARCA